MTTGRASKPARSADSGARIGGSAYPSPNACGAAAVRSAGIDRRFEPTLAA